MTITAGIARQDTFNVLLEKQSLVNILFSSTLPMLGLESRIFFPYHHKLYAFDETQVHILGYLNLWPRSALIGLFPVQAGVVAHFLVVDHPSPYSAIFGRPLLPRIQVTLCYTHGLYTSSGSRVWQRYSLIGRNTTTSRTSSSQKTN